MKYPKDNPVIYDISSKDYEFAWRKKMHGKE